MQKLCFSLLSLLLGVVSPAFAEGFASTQFALLVVVNLLLGGILTLFVGVLASVLLEKLRAGRKVEVRVVAREKRV